MPVGGSRTGAIGFEFALIPNPQEVTLDVLATRTKEHIMKLNWLDSYYEALEFFYFEPQHMRRKGSCAGTTDGGEHGKALQVPCGSEAFAGNGSDP
jgi:hypothetical protein